MRTNSYVCGTFNGIGTAGVYICCGFMPEWVRVVNLEDADIARVEWNIHFMRTAELARGLLLSVADVAQDARAVGDGGIVPYGGGGAMDGTYYLVPIEQRYDDSYKNQRYHQTNKTLVTKWTLGSSTNHTGNFDKAIDTTYVGEGSLVQINGVWYGLNALSNDGDAANDVTLSDAAPDGGRVECITPMYDYVVGESGKMAPPGFLIEWTNVVNVSGEMCWFEAGTFAN